MAIKCYHASTISLDVGGHETCTTNGNYSVRRGFEEFFCRLKCLSDFTKKSINDRFSITNDQLRMREALRFTGKVMSTTLSRVANRWFVSITVDTQDLSQLSQAKNQGVVGVDLGVSAFSTGEPPVPGPKAQKWVKKFGPKF